MTTAISLENQHKGEFAQGIALGLCASAHRLCCQSYTLALPESQEQKNEPALREPKPGHKALWGCRCPSVPPSFRLEKTKSCCSHRVQRQRQVHAPAHSCPSEKPTSGSSLRHFGGAIPAAKSRCFGGTISPEGKRFFSVMLPLAPTPRGQKGNLQNEYAAAMEMAGFELICRPCAAQAGRPSGGEKQRVALASRLIPRQPFFCLMSQLRLSMPEAPG